MESLLLYRVYHSAAPFITQTRSKSPALNVKE